MDWDKEAYVSLLLAGVSGRRDLSAVYPQQLVQRKESCRRSHSLDCVGTGNVEPRRNVLYMYELDFKVVFCIQFQDSEFGGLSGCRIVRIAVNPDYQGVNILL